MTYLLLAIPEPFDFVKDWGSLPKGEVHGLFSTREKAKERLLEWYSIVGVSDPIWNSSTTLMRSGDVIEYTTIQWESSEKVITVNFVIFRITIE